MNVLSLFDGMSCGRIALNRTGIKYDNYYASEIDKHAIKVTQANFPNTIQLGDVTKVFAKDLPKVDLLIGGSPCQGFSFAGKQLNFKDERSKLFFEYVRLKEECNPTYFLLENVQMKKEYELVINRLLKCRPLRFNSSWVSAQNRKRLYWTNIPVDDIPKKKNLIVNDILDKSEMRFPSELVQHNAKNSKFMLTRARKSSGRIISLMAQRATSITLNDGSVRYLNRIECERLQNIPEGYTNCITEGQAKKQLGNGWTIDIIVHIFKYMIPKL